MKDARPVKLLAPVNALMPVVVKFPATVELAWETNPLAKVARSVRLRVPAERTPMFPFVLKRFVLDAVVEKRLVVVAFTSVVEVAKRFVVVALVKVALAAENEPPPVRLKTPETERSPVTVVVARPVAPDAERVVAETAVPDI